MYNSNIVKFINDEVFGGRFWTIDHQIFRLDIVIWFTILVNGTLNTFQRLLFNHQCKWGNDDRIPSRW